MSRPHSGERSSQSRPANYYAHSANSSHKESRFRVRKIGATSPIMDVEVALLPYMHEDGADIIAAVRDEVEKPSCFPHGYVRVFTPSIVCVEGRT
jgi:hypothetical protein